jgi:hypothetical protein
VPTPASSCRSGPGRASQSRPRYSGRAVASHWTCNSAAVPCAVGKSHLPCCGSSVLHGRLDFTCGGAYPHRGDTAHVVSKQTQVLRSVAAAGQCISQADGSVSVAPCVLDGANTNQLVVFSDTDRGTLRYMRPQQKATDLAYNPAAGCFSR